MEEFDPAKLFVVTITETRTGTNPQYINLSGYDFSNESKIWVCKGLNGELEDDLHWISLNVAKDCHATVNFCKLFNLNVSTVKKWRVHFKNNDFQHAHSGKPKMIDENEMLAIANKVATARPRLTTVQMCEALKVGAKVTAQKRGCSIVGISNIECLSRNSFSSYVNEYKLTSRTGQPVFQDRAKAIADCRLACCWVVVFMAVFGQLPSYKKWNSDQSMVGIEPNGTNVKVWISNQEEVDEHDRLVVSNAQVLLKI